MQVKVLPGMFQAANLDMETREPVMGLTINGTPVPRAEFALWLLHSRGESYVRTFAEHWLVERKAASLGLSATPAEIEARTQWFLDRMVDMKHDGSRETWKTYLLKTGRDEDAMLRQFRQRMKIDLLAERILMAERKITNEQVHARYAQLYGENGRWIEARVIQLDFVPPPLEPGLSRDELEQRLAAERAKLRTAAEGVRRRLDDGEDFATLARAINTDAGLKSRGGKLDGRFRPDTWPEDVGRAVSELSPGQLAGPLEVERGYAIFEVLTSKPVPFDEVAAQLRHELETEPIPESDLAAYRNVLVKQARVEELAPMYE
jgi:hypothetical protein